MLLWGLSAALICQAHGAYTEVGGLQHGQPIGWGPKWGAESRAVDKAGSMGQGLQVEQPSQQPKQSIRLDREQKAE